MLSRHVIVPPVDEIGVKWREGLRALKPSSLKEGTVSSRSTRPSYVLPSQPYDVEASSLEIFSRAPQGVQSKQAAATCNAVLSSPTEMRLIASISVGPLTALISNLNDMSLSMTEDTI